MKIHYLTGKPTEKQVSEMLEAHGEFIKLAVDLKLRVLAGGGEMHVDCEEVLLDAGSEQEHIWGGDWNPDRNLVDFGSFINIRPRQGNRSMEIESADRRRLFEEITRAIFQGAVEGPATRLGESRVRYTRDPVPVRLGNLASSLNRLGKCAADPGRGRIAADHIRECVSFLEWVAPDAEPEIQPHLKEMQFQLMEWSRRWSPGDVSLSARNELSQFAKEQSDRVLDWSGLLTEA